MHRYFLAIIVMLSLTIPKLAAQSDFREGYIVTSGHDTLSGKISYKPNSKTSKSCWFRNGTETQEFSPDQITGFGYVSDKYFTSQVIKGLFVEVLVSGELSLFRSDYDFYVQKQGSEVYKLESKQIRDTAEVVREGTTERIYGYREDVRWRGILSVLTTDCTDSYQTIQNMTLGEKDLTKFVVEYNLCKGVPFRDYKSKKKWISFDFGVAAGVSLSALKFTQMDYLHDYLAEKYTSWNPSLGLSMYISSPRVNERIALLAELYYFRARFYSDVVGHQGLATAYYETHIDMSTLAVPVTIRYMFPVRQSSMFLNAGIELDNHFDATSKLYTELVTSNTVNSKEGEAINITKNQIGITGGVGYSRSLGKMNLGANLRYFQAGSVRTNTGYNYDLSRLSLSIILAF